MRDLFSFLIFNLVAAFACVTASAAESAQPALPHGVSVEALVGGIVAVLVICAVLIAVFKKKQ